MQRKRLRITWLFWLFAILATAAGIYLYDPRVGRLWWNTSILAVGACLLAMPLGTTAAVLIVKTNAPGRQTAALLLIGMLAVPLFLIAGAWDAGFGIQGWHTLTTNPHLARRPWLEGWRAAIWIHGLAAAPWVALIVGAGLAAVESELEEVAALSMRPWRVVWQVSLRRAAPAVAAAALWVAIVVSVEISVTDFFQVRTFAEEVYTQAALGVFDFGARSAAGGVDISRSHSAVGQGGMWLGLAFATLLALAAVMAIRRLSVDLAHVSLRQTWRWRLGRLCWLGTGLLGIVLLLIVGVPLGNLLYKAGGRSELSPTGLERSWSAKQVAERVAGAPGEFGDDLLLSGALAGVVAVSAVALAAPWAWSLRRSKRRPFARVFGLAVCLTVPGPLLGIAVIRLLNQPPGSAFGFLAPLYDSYFPPWMVQTIRALPLVTLMLWAAFASIPQTLLDAAALDGAGWGKQLMLIALPQRRSAVAAALVVAAAVACSELAATVLVVPPGRSTAISVRVFQLLHYGVDDRVAAISLLLAVSLAAVVGLAGAVAVHRAK